MEDVLTLYEHPYDEEFPVVCIDERPCQLTEEKQPSQPPNQDNPSEKIISMSVTAPAICLWHFNPYKAGDTLR